MGKYYIDFITEEDIQLLEKDIDDFIAFMDRPKRITRSLHHLIQTEFDHVDWDSPVKTLPPRRAVDWAARVDPDQRRPSCWSERPNDFSNSTSAAIARYLQQKASAERRMRAKARAAEHDLFLKEHYKRCMERHGHEGPWGYNSI